MNRKRVVVSVLSIAFIISSITNVVIILNYPQDSNAEDLSTLVVGISDGPNTLEIVEAWDDASNVVLEQVAETLFSNDLRDPALPRINLLAESYYWHSNTSVQIKLREDILFHDGTPFNSTAAKWNLDRLLYLTNCTGNNMGEIAQTQSLWKRPDGKTPIINSVEVINEYNITIALNAPYGPFLNLLTYINAGMISPTAHSDNLNEFIRLNDKIIGTGPFKFEYYNPDVEVVLSRWNLYRENVAYFDRLQFKIFDDDTKAHEEMLAGKIDFNFMANDADILAYEASEDITVKHYTDDSGIPSLIYQYICFNNTRLNSTWRKAMSFIINYTYVIEELQQGNVIQANSPISPGFGLSYNESAKAPSYNLTKAREIVVSMGFGDMSWNDTQWSNVVESASPFLSVEYLYNLGNTFKQDMEVAFTEWFKLIGIEVNTPHDGFLTSWIPPDYYLNPLVADLYILGWVPDYLDPYNMLDSIFNPISSSNSALVNDTKLNTMMSLALETTDDTARNIIYKNIQGYLTETCFHAPLYHTKVISVHSASLRNVPYNAMQKFQAYGIWRV